METLDIYGDCPKCGESWDAGPIPEEHREHYSEPYRFSKLIYVKEYGENWNKLPRYWQCPHCKEKV